MHLAAKYLTGVKFSEALMSVIHYVSMVPLAPSEFDSVYKLSEEDFSGEKVGRRGALIDV